MTDTSTRTEADRYARSIADELRTWERAAAGDPDAIAVLGEVREHTGADDAPTVAEYVNACALAVETWRGERDASAVRVEILRTYGGPSCRIEWDSRYPALFAVSVVWGGESAAVEVYARTLGNQLEEVYA